MQTLLEFQLAMRERLLQHDNGATARFLSDDVNRDRLDIYRNTILNSLTKALRLSYPVVQSLVGVDFFEGAAQLFITKQPARAAYLDQYGSEFPEFLRHFPPAASLGYLADVARLEWAVNCSLHAPDLEPLELAKLAAIGGVNQSQVCFVPDPALRLIKADYPVDRIWRVVAAGNSAELTNLDIDAGPVNLLVERRGSGVAVNRLDEPAWRFLAALCDGAPLHSAINSAPSFDVSTALAEHLAAGRFVAFELTADGPTATFRGAAA